MHIDDKNIGYIEQCYVTGSVTTNTKYTGGLIGYSCASLDNNNETININEINIAMFSNKKITLSISNNSAGSYRSFHFNRLKQHGGNPRNIGL